jgi:hypothetical protein
MVYITFRITEFLDFIHRPVLKKLENRKFLIEVIPFKETQQSTCLPPLT